MDSESETPPGWSGNPSSWSQRLPIAALAMVGFFISTYLTLYQLDLIPTVWEPFFGDGSKKVLDSKISHALPVPDAALGAAGYLADAVTAVVGGRRRWRQIPWMVVLFGFAIGPLGAVSIFLVVSQPVFVGAWCTLCLISAVISVLMIGPAVDEVLASLQHVRREHARGRPVTRALLGTPRLAAYLPR